MRMSKLPLIISALLFCSLLSASATRTLTADAIQPNSGSSIKFSSSLLFDANNSYTIGDSTHNLLNIYAGQIESDGIFFTAISGAGNFQSNGANKFYTYDQSGSNSALVSVFSGVSDTESTGDISLYSGDVTDPGSTGHSGQININSGQIVDASGSGNTGPLIIKSGDNAGTGNSGDLTLNTGSVTSGTRGNIILNANALPGSDNTIILGASGSSYANVFTNEISTPATDLILNVTGGTNSVLPATDLGQRIGGPSQRFAFAYAQTVVTDTVDAPNVLGLESDNGAIQAISQAEQIQFQSYNGVVAPSFQFFNKDNNQSVSLKAPNSLASTYTMVWPTAQGGASTFLQNDGAGNLSWVSGSGGANTSLSNLTTTSINQDLLPGGDLTLSLGSSSLRWQHLWAGDWIDASSNIIIAGTTRALLDSSGGGQLVWSTPNLLSLVGTAPIVKSPDDGGASPGPSTAVEFATGDINAVASANNSGDLVVNTGSINDGGSTGNTGALTVFTGDNNGASGNSGNINISTGASSAGTGDITLHPGSGTTRGKITLSGHLKTAGGSPGVSACGSGPSISGDDQSGRVTVGTGGIASSCTVTFAEAYSAAPHCFLNDQTGIIAIQAVTTTTTLTINATVAFAASSLIDYFCVSN